MESAGLFGADLFDFDVVPFFELYGLAEDKYQFLLPVLQSSDC
jgi:hypothetical protein